MATNQELTNTQNQWQVLSDTMQRIWETMNGNLVTPPNFPREVIDMLDENIRIFYFDLLRLYDMTVIAERAASAGSFRGFFPNSAALDNLPISSMREGDFAYLVSPATIWTWTEEGGWANSGVAVPTGVAAPSAINPLADNQAGQRGTNNTFALADHRHPFSPEFNRVRADIADLFNQVQQRYIRPSAGIPISHLDPELQQFILDTKGTLFFNILVNTTAVPVGARVGDYIQNQSTGERTIGNLSTYIGDVVRIVSLNPFQVIMAGNNRGPRGEHGTTTFRIVNNTTTAPTGARINDLIMNTGTDARTVGNRTYQIGDIGEITSLVPFQVAVPGNNQGPRGFPGRDAPPFPTIIVGMPASRGGDGTLANCDFLCSEDEEANDVTIINQAISQLPTTGGLLIIRPGIYNIRTNMTARIHLTIEGFNKNSVLNVFNGRCTLSNFMIIKNLKFTGMPFLTMSTNCTLENCFFEHRTDTTSISLIDINGHNITIKNCVINCEVGDPTRTDRIHCFVLDSSRGEHIRNITLENNTFVVINNSGNVQTFASGARAAVSALSFSDSLIIKNKFMIIKRNNVLASTTAVFLIYRFPILVSQNRFIENQSNNVPFFANGANNNPILDNIIFYTKELTPFFIDTALNYNLANTQLFRTPKSTTIIIGIAGKHGNEVDFLVPEGANAGPVFNEAFNALTENGGEIIVREGEYIFNTRSVLNNRHNITIKGINARLVVALSNINTINGIFTCSNSSNISITGFTFIGRNAYTSNMAIQAQNHSGLLEVKNNIFKYIIRDVVLIESPQPSLVIIANNNLIEGSMSFIRTPTTGLIDKIIVKDNIINLVDSIATGQFIISQHTNTTVIENNTVIGTINSANYTLFFTNIRGQNGIVSVRNNNINIRMIAEVTTNFTAITTGFFQAFNMTGTINISANAIFINSNVARAIQINQLTSGSILRGNIIIENNSGIFRHIEERNTNALVFILNQLAASNISARIRIKDNIARFITRGVFYNTILSDDSEGSLPGSETSMERANNILAGFNTIN